MIRRLPPKVAGASRRSTTRPRLSCFCRTFSSSRRQIRRTGPAFATESRDGPRVPAGPQVGASVTTAAVKAASSVCPLASSRCVDRL
jgi:hypothetical protein